MYVWMDVDFLSTKKGKKVNLSVNAMTNFHKTWYVSSGGHKY